MVASMTKISQTNMFLIKAKLFFHKECVKSIMSDHILQFLHIVIIISTLTKKNKNKNNETNHTIQPEKCHPFITPQDFCKTQQTNSRISDTVKCHAINLVQILQDAEIAIPFI